MKPHALFRRLLVPLVVVAGVALVASCAWLPRAGSKGRKKERKREKKLALLSKEEARKANARCYECHVDFKEEELAEEHEKHGVTCVRCHGHSQPHLDDEVRKTPPDAIFRGRAMKAFCLTCHDPVKHATEKEHVAEAARAKKAGKPERTCTACHGEHELIDTEAAKKKAPKPKKGK